MTEAQGSSVILNAGFSASLLFQRMASSVRPVPAMFRAVVSIQQAGERTCRKFDNGKYILLAEGDQKLVEDIYIDS